MDYFKDLKSLFNAMQDDIQESLLEEVHDKTAEVMSKKVVSEVYDVYTPKVYQRREDNSGLSDKDNVISSIIHRDSNSVSMLTQNRTKGKGNKGYIAGLVEYGHDNGYGEYDFPIEGKDPDAYPYLKPRPFISETEKEMRTTGDHAKALKEGLKKKGYDFYR